VCACSMGALGGCGTAAYCCALVYIPLLTPLWAQLGWVHPMSPCVHAGGGGGGGGGDDDFDEAELEEALRTWRTGPHRHAAAALLLAVPICRVPFSVCRAPFVRQGTWTTRTVAF